MADILAELFDQFLPEEQAQIKAAEAAANAILAQGGSGVRDRLRTAGSLRDRDWILEPQDEARAGAAGEVFVAYGNVLWNRMKPALCESVQQFLAQLDRVREGVLARHGRWECKDAIAELQAEYEKQAWLTHSQQLASARAQEATPTQPETGAKANAQTQQRRRELVKRYRADHDLAMPDLARRATTSVTAIQGMVKGNRSRYSEQTLLRFLKVIGVPPDQW